MKITDKGAHTWMQGQAHDKTRQQKIKRRDSATVDGGVNKAYNKLIIK